MSLKSVKQFEHIFKLLTKYNFELNDNVPNDLKCIKCQKIINDACQVACGCRFCRVCIEELLSNDGVTCPGNTEDCIFEILSEFQSDIVGNRKISKLELKCPRSSCGTKCKLIDMTHHLSICSGMNEESPLDASEDQETIFGLRTLVERLKASQEIHRNDIDILKSNEENHTNELEMMKKHLASQDEQIRKLNEEISLVKTKEAELVQQMERLIQLMDNASDNISEPICLEKMNTLIGYPAFASIFQHPLWRPNEVLGKSMKTDRIDNSITFRWPIASIGYENIQSGCFPDTTYRLTLEMDPRVTDFIVYLRVHADGASTKLQWPFRAEVTMKIIDSIKTTLIHVVTKHCQTERPLVNSSRCSEPFTFPLYDLLANKVLNNFIIECCVECD